jgi:hypothetical protein
LTPPHASLHTGDSKVYLAGFELLKGQADPNSLENARRVVEGMVEFQLQALTDKVDVIKKALEGKDEMIKKALEGKDETIKSKDEMIKKALEGKDETIKGKDETIKGKDETIKSKDEMIKKALEGKDETIKSKDDAIKSKDEMIATLKEYRMHVINEKTSQLAIFKAQYEPRIMIDILYSALDSSPAFDGKQRNKWRTLLDDVLCNGKLTASATADLADLDGSKDLQTVLADLPSLSNRLSSTHHKGAADFEGAGWRLGVSPSPGLATALVIAAVARKQRKQQVDFTLRGPVIYLDQRAKKHREFDVASLRWVRTDWGS